MAVRGGCPQGWRVEAEEFISVNVYSVALLSSPRGHSDAHWPFTGKRFTFSGVQVEVLTRDVPAVMPPDSANPKRRITGGNHQRNVMLKRDITPLTCRPDFSFTLTLTFREKFSDRILSRVIIFILPRTPSRGNQGWHLHPPARAGRERGLARINGATSAVIGASTQFSRCRIVGLADSTSRM